MLDESALIQKASEVRKIALALYSNFHVGAALITRNQKIYTGCNIESSSYGLTICAERVALFKALSEGERQFEAIAIVSDARELCPPCGACRQVLWDFARNITVIMANDYGDVQRIKLHELLPMAFDSAYLGGGIK
ncbi:cytidine deaminase [candidate division KSB1 bacterium]|nr:cytidine deaminase [candidate division KSB1 bacterium]